MSEETVLDGGFFETLGHWSRRNADAPAILATGGRAALSWAELPGVLSGLTQTLRDCGIGQASRVVIILPAGAEAVTTFLSVMAAGIAVPLNPELTSVELKESLIRLRPHLIIFRSGLPGNVSAVAAELGLPTLELDWHLADVSGATRVKSASGALKVSRGDPLAAAPGTRMILQTSGTTARPKLVPLSEANLEASASALIASLSLSREDRGLNLLPQFHIGGLWDLVAGPLLAGGSVICAGTFSCAAFEAGCRLAPTWVQLVPAMLRTVIREAPVSRGRLRFVRSVSAALLPALKAEAERRLAVPVVEIYGMTETAGLIAGNPLAQADQVAGSVGRVAGLEVAIRDSSGAELADGLVGEVVVRGAQVSQGYIDAMPEDASAFGVHGFRTGDLGRFDGQGNLWLVGRSKDLINRGGEMISPVEVEAALLALPGVIDAAAFGLPHEDLGEEVAAVVVLATGVLEHDVAPQLQAAAKRVLGLARTPSKLFLATVIPRTAGGKLRRQVLTDQYASSAVASGAGTRSHESLPPEWPQDPLPRWVAEVWASILGLAVIGPDQDFFESGGSSLQAAQAAAIVQDRSPEEIIYVSSVYEAPTPRLQAEFLLKNHPTLAASVMGESLGGDSVRVEPVDSGLFGRFRAAIRDPLPAVHIPSKRNARMVFIVGAPRSGSTLLRAMLAGHSRLFAPPELYLLSHADLQARRSWYSQAYTSQLEGLPRAWMSAAGLTASEAIAHVEALEEQNLGVAAAYGVLQKAIGSRILVDKTPYYGVHAHVLDAADSIFEDAFYIHLSRHPYGMIRSFEEARLSQLWWPRLAGPGAGRCPFHPRQLAEMIWERIHRNVTGFLASVTSERSHHLRYEDLLLDPEASLSRLAGAIGVEFEPGMLEPLGDPSSRMTDGLHPGSRMIGDPKFHRHRTIDGSAAERWQDHYDRDFLSGETWEVAIALGHSKRIAQVSRREIFDV